MDQDINLPAVDSIKNVKDIMYNMHFYAATHKQLLRNRCDSTLAKELPIFILEFAGMEASGDGKIDMPEWIKWLDWAQKETSPRWFGLSPTCSMLKKFANSDGNWQSKDLKHADIDTKLLLKKYH